MGGDYDKPWFVKERDGLLGNKVLSKQDNYPRARAECLRLRGESDTPEIYFIVRATTEVEWV